MLTVEAETKLWICTEWITFNLATCLL